MSFNGKMRKIRDSKLIITETSRVGFPVHGLIHVNTCASFKHQFKQVINFKHYEQVVNIENGLSEA